MAIHTQKFMLLFQRQGLIVNGGLSVEHNLDVKGNVKFLGSVTDNGINGKQLVDKFAETSFNIGTINPRGHAFLDKSNTIRFASVEHHNRANTGNYGHDYGAWFDVQIPSDHNKELDPIEKLYVGRHEIFCITKNGVGFSAGYNAYGLLANVPNYSNVKDVPRKSDTSMSYKTRQTTS